MICLGIEARTLFFFYPTLVHSQIYQIPSTKPYICFRPVSQSLPNWLVHVNQIGVEASKATSQSMQGRKLSCLMEIKFCN